MKKLFFLIIAALVMLPASAFAGNVYLEGSGTYGSFNYAGTMTGFSGGLGYNFIPDVNLYAKYLSGTGSTIDSSKVKTAAYKHEIFMGAVEYNYQIMNLPVFWSNSIGAGMADITVSMLDPAKDLNAPTKLYDKNEAGLYLVFATGVRYHVSQHVGIYATAGYQMVTGFKKDLINRSVNGYQLCAGVSFTIWGQNSSITEGY